MDFNIKSLSRCFFLLTLTLLVSACGENKEEKSDKANTQVVAKVNGDEISIHQVNLMLNRLGPLNEEQTKAASKQILQKLVDLQLLKQKAIEAKLDRDPTVLQTIEASKSQIMAQAYVERNMSSATKPTASEIDRYYDEHPELFKERRIFNIQELAVEASSDKLAEFEQVIADNQNMGEIASWLKEKGYKFALNANVRAAEQLPLNLLIKLQQLNNGDIIAIQNGQAINIVTVAASQSQPISKEKAAPLIEKYFINLNKKEEVELQMAAIKKAANIEFIGLFSDMQLEKDSVVENNTSSKNEVQDTQPKEDASVKSDADQSTLDKGLAGF